MASPPDSGQGSSLDPTILPASHWQQAQLQQHEDNDDADSTRGSIESSTVSLAESVLQYRTIQGRTYHSERGTAQSWTPNDENHSESLDLYHHTCTLILDGKLFLAPIKPDVQKVIDIGTGTGVWAIDFGDEFPSAEVTGTDLSPMQPTWVPTNVKFEIDDASLEWTWDDNIADYVHIRGLLGCIADWNALFKSAYRVIKPGGWVESYEWSTLWGCDDGPVPEHSPFGQWTKVFWEAGRKSGRSFRVIEDDLQEKGMREAGFVDITVKDIRVPVGGWPKDPKQQEIGLYSIATLDTDLEGWLQYIWGTVMGWTKEEIQVYIAHVKQQMHNPKTHGWYKHRVVYGRKPE